MSRTSSGHKREDREPENKKKRKSHTQKKLEYDFQKLDLDDLKIDDWMFYFSRPEFVKEYPQESILTNTLMRVPHQPSLSIPAMAVYLNDGGYWLKYNPKWLQDEMTQKEDIMYVMAHEAYHIVMKDIPRTMKRLALTPKDKMQLVNDIYGVAADWQNNGMLAQDFDDFKKGQVTSKACYPEDAGFERDRSQEQYAEAMIQVIDDIENEMEKLKMQARGGDQSDKQQRKNPYSQGQPKPSDKNEMSNLDQMVYDIVKNRQNNQNPWGGQDEDHQQQDKDDQQQQQRQQGQQDEDKPQVQGADLQDSTSGLEELVQGMDAEELNQLTDKLDKDSDRRLQQAVDMAGKGRGTVPESLERQYEKITEDKEIPWEQRLLNASSSRVETSTKANWNKPNDNLWIMHQYNEETDELEELERAIPVYPKREKEMSYTGIYAMDVSGSVGEKEFKTALSKLSGTIKKVDDGLLIACQVTTRLESIHLLDADNIDEYDTREGSGGTAFDEPFELADVLLRNKSVPEKWHDFKDTIEKAQRRVQALDLLVYHTDGMAPMPDINPKYPVMWCVTGRKTYPGSNLDSKDEVPGEVISYQP